MRLAGEDDEQGLNAVVAPILEPIELPADREPSNSADTVSGEGFQEFSPVLHTAERSVEVKRLQALAILADLAHKPNQRAAQLLCRVQLVDREVLQVMALRDKLAQRPSVKFV